MNGGIRVGWKKIQGAKKYVLKVRDYNNKIHTVNVPNNVSSSYAYARDYEIFKTSIGDMIYWNIKKIDDYFHAINPWMNKNNKLYKIKIIAYSDAEGKKVLTKSNWLLVTPFNVQKDSPEQNVMLPNLTSTMSDPEKGKEGTNLDESANKAGKIYTKRFEITEIKEQDSKVYIKWENRVKNFNVSFYAVRYRRYNSNKESANINREYTDIILNNNIDNYTIENLTNEKEYLVTVVAYGKIEENELAMLSEEVVVAHTKETRKARISSINQKRGDPYYGPEYLTGYFTRSQAEAFANYGKNGKAFTSKTKYFLWVNMSQVRLYIFTKTKTSKWRLWDDMPVSICKKDGTHATPSGEFTLKGREWNDHGENGYALRYLINYQDYSFGNVFHSVGVGSENTRIDSRNRFSTAGCTLVDMPWLKWIYDYGMGSTVFNDYGNSYK